jgi:hypothetical protein
VVRKQLRGSIPAASNGQNLVVAYEPVWAIGTGLTPTAADVAEVHALIREELRRLVGKGEQAKVRVLYGGSVKPSNAAELMAVENVDGALVGGASLVAADFLAIAGAYLRRTGRCPASGETLPCGRRPSRSGKRLLRAFDPGRTYATGRRNERTDCERPTPDGGAAQGFWKRCKQFSSSST